MLEVNGLVTSYGLIKALRNVSLQAEKGKLTCILGPNGAGKSTLLFTIAGILKSEKGSIRFLNKEISKIKTYNLNDLDLYLQNKDSLRLAFLDGITDTKNFGSIIRNAECFGIDGIVISKTGSAQINDETIKTSSGAIFNIPIYKVDHLLDAIFLVKEQNFIILGADEKSKKQLKSLKFNNKTIVILGSEGKGISSPVLKKCDDTFKIPLQGNIESLNVSVAAGIVMYEISESKTKE